MTTTAIGSPQQEDRKTLVRNFVPDGLDVFGETNLYRLGGCGLKLLRSFAQINGAQRFAVGLPAH